MALCRSLRQATANRTPGRRRDSSDAARIMSGRLRFTSWVREPRQDRHHRAGPSGVVGEEPGVQRPTGQLVEIGMADVDRIRDAPRLVPRRLERQAAEHLVHVLLHLLRPATPPRPRAAAARSRTPGSPRLGPPGDPPVQPRIVDQDDRVGPVVAEIAVGLDDQADERDDVQQDVEEPHHRQVDQRIEQLGRPRRPSSPRRSRRTPDPRPAAAGGSIGSDWRRAGRRWAPRPR